MQQRVTAIVVNFNTARLTRRCVKSVQCYYPQMPVVIVDNASNHMPEIERLNAECVAPRILKSSINRGHGPGLSAGVAEARTPLMLFLDSDAYLVRAGLIEALEEVRIKHDAYAVGHLMLVGRRKVRYIHPYCSLIDRAKFIRMPKGNLAGQGAPLIQNMTAAGKAGYKVVDALLILSEYVVHDWHGTVRRTGDD